METSNERSFRSRGTKVLAGIGLVVVIILILWGAVGVVRMLPNAFAGLQSAAITLTSIFTPANEEQLTLTVSNPAIDVETPFTIAWNHDKQNEGAYQFSYTCREGVSLQLNGNDGAFNEITCQTPVRLLSIDNTATLIATSDENRFTSLPLAVAFEAEDGEISATDTVIVTIVNAAVGNEEAAAEEENKETTDTPSNQTAGEEEEELFEITIEEQPIYSDPNGFVDLEGRILAVGYIDNNNNFVATSSVPTSARVAVQFEVENVGTKFSPTWYFRAVLPTQVIHFFDSPEQRVLFPGDRIEYTLGFDGVKSGEVDVVVNVDPDTLVGESSEVNNIVKDTITVYTE